MLFCLQTGPGPSIFLVTNVTLDGAPTAPEPAGPAPRHHVEMRTHGLGTACSLRIIPGKQLQANLGFQRSHSTLGWDTSSVYLTQDTQTHPWTRLTRAVKVTLPVQGCSHLEPTSTCSTPSASNELKPTPFPSCTVEAMTNTETSPSWEEHSETNVPLRVDPLLESSSSVSAQNIHLSPKPQESFFSFLSKVKSNYKHLFSGLTHKYTVRDTSGKHAENAPHSLGALKRGIIFLLQVPWHLHR